MKKKTGFVSILTAVIAFAVILATVTVGPWAALFLGISSLSDPPKPEITSSEFPFRLVYEIKGETKVVEDTLICEFDGIGMDEGNGKYRKWKTHMASGNQKVLLLNADGAPGVVFGDEKTVTQEIYFDPGPAWYYMGDPERSKGYQPPFPDGSFSEKYPNGSGSSGILPADDLPKKYNIKLVSLDIAPPIKNNFPTTKK